MQLGNEGSWYGLLIVDSDNIFVKNVTGKRQTENHLQEK